MREAIDGRQPLINFHREHSVHQIERLCTHLARILLLERLLFAQLGELETDEARIRIKTLLQRARQLSHDFLNAEELIDLGLARKKRITIRDFTHDATDGPNIDLSSIVSTEK